MQPVLSALAEAFEKIGLPLRSVENEWGPGQVECTFAARDALDRRRQPAAVPHRDPADLPPHGPFRDLHVPAGAEGLLFERLASASVAGRCARAGAICSCRRARARCSRRSAAILSAACCSTPRRDRVHDADRQRLPPLPAELAGARPRHLVLRPPRRHDPRARRARTIRRRRLENRVGEPAANPYLFMMSQIVAGLDGIAQKRDPGPQIDEPYASDCPLLPKSLPRSARRAGAGDRCSAEQLGDVFVDYFLKLKRNETGRFQRWLEEHGVQGRRRGDDRVGAARVFRFFLGRVLIKRNCSQRVATI